jgi:hypothetical protein
MRIHHGNGDAASLQVQSDICALVLKVRLKVVKDNLAAAMGNSKVKVTYQGVGRMSDLLPDIPLYLLAYLSSFRNGFVKAFTDSNGKVAGYEVRVDVSRWGDIILDNNNMLLVSTSIENLDDQGSDALEIFTYTVGRNIDERGSDQQAAVLKYDYVKLDGSSNQKVDVSQAGMIITSPLAKSLTIVTKNGGTFVTDMKAMEFRVCSAFPALVLRGSFWPSLPRRLVAEYRLCSSAAGQTSPKNISRIISAGNAEQPQAVAINEVFAYYGKNTTVPVYVFDAPTSYVETFIVEKTEPGGQSVVGIDATGYLQILFTPSSGQSDYVLLVTPVIP